MATNSTRLAPQQSLVIASGIRLDGKEITQEITLPHESGVTDGELIAFASKMVRANGGLMLEGPEKSVELYPLLTFDRVRFSIKRVTLALSNLSVMH